VLKSPSILIDRQMSEKTHPRHSDKITGKWEQPSGSSPRDFLISYSGGEVLGNWDVVVRGSSPSTIKLKGTFYVDRNKNDQFDSKDLAIASARLNFDVIKSFPEDFVSGRFVAYADGCFRAFYGSEKIMTGTIFEPQNFF
jgi:hypothetical protein